MLEGIDRPPKSSRTFQPRSCFLFGFARDELDDVAIVSSSKYPLSLLQSVLFVGPAFTAPLGRCETAPEASPPEAGLKIY